MDLSIPGSHGNRSVSAEEPNEVKEQQEAEEGPLCRERFSAVSSGDPRADGTM